MHTPSLAAHSAYPLYFIDNTNAARKHFILEIIATHTLANHPLIHLSNTVPEPIPDRCCRSSRVLRTNLISGHCTSSTFAAPCYRSRLRLHARSSTDKRLRQRVFTTKQPSSDFCSKRNDTVDVARDASKPLIEILDKLNPTLRSYP